MAKIPTSSMPTPAGKLLSESETSSKETATYSGIDPQDLIDHLLEEIACGNLRYVSVERKRKLGPNS
jgi:hypothetical protein